MQNYETGDNSPAVIAVHNAEIETLKTQVGIIAAHVGVDIATEDVKTKEEAAKEYQEIAQIIDRDAETQAAEIAAAQIAPNEEPLEGPSEKPITP